MARKEYRKIRRDGSIISTRSSSENLSKTGSSDSEYLETSSTQEDDFVIAVIEREENLRYGWGNFAPNCLQWCCTPQFLLVSFMFVAFCQGYFVHGVIPSSLGPLQGRFHFNMRTMGFIREMYDFGLVIGFVPVAFFNTRGVKRSLVIGISCFFMAIGALTCALPHFFIGFHDTKGWELAKLKEICFPNENFSDDFNSTLPNENFTDDFNSSLPITTRATDISTSTNSAKMPCQTPDLDSWKYVFMLGVFLNGVGGAAYFTMGIAFLDESVSPRKSVLYTGALNAALLLGVCIGLAVDAEILRTVFVDFDRSKGMPKGMMPSNPRWRGAWWLDMLIAAALFTLAALPVFGFPSKIPGGLKAHLEGLRTNSPDEEETDTADADEPRSIWKSIKTCLMNVTYLGLTLEQITCWALITSVSAFMPSYLKAVYSVSGKLSRMSSGTIVLFALFGSITGAYIQHRFKLSVIGNLRLSLASAIAFLVFLAAFFIDCREAEFAGWTISYPVNDSFQAPSNHSNATCNSHCIDSCKLDDYDEFCHRGPHPNQPNLKILFYFSTCYAGCAYANSSGGYDCTCVPKNQSSFEGGGNISPKACSLKKCDYRLGAATVMFSWCAFFVFVRLNPLQHSLLRCIHSKDRIVGLTVSALLARLLGALPASPVVGGVLFKACKVFGQICNNADRLGECYWRDDKVIVRNIAIAAYVMSITGIIGLLLAIWDQTQLGKRIATTTKTKTPKSKRPRRRQTESPNRVDEGNNDVLKCDKHLMKKLMTQLNAD